MHRLRTAATVKVVIASKNEHKQQELQRLMQGTNIQILNLSQFRNVRSVIENGKTFEENAEKKARIYSIKTKSLALADDSGLMVRALNGAPGVYSARYAGVNCSYEDNNRKLLKSIKLVSWPKRLATFVSVVSIYDNGLKIATVRGECEGKIGFGERGGNGFGYDPIFIPKGSSKTYAELTHHEKNLISHRGKALIKAKKVLMKYLRKKNISA